MQLITFFWGLCTLKTAPQDLPASSFLLGLVLPVYFATSLVVAMLQWPVSTAILAALLDTALLTMLTRLLLWVRLLSGRFLQTLTALAGSGALLAVLAVPLVLWQQQAGAAADGIAALPSVLLLLWTGWNVVVVGHILRHALSTLLALGIGLAAVYAYISFQLMRILFPN